MNRYDFVVSTAMAAGEMILDLRGREVEVSTKNNDARDIVTNVDLAVSDFATKEIEKNFPGEVIYSEEADADVSAGSFWAIDPVDGTASFSRGIPHFSFVIAFVEGGLPTVGAIYNPVTKEMFSFEKGRGAFMNGREVSVSQIKDLSKAHIFFRAGRKPEFWDWGASAYRFLLEHANKTANFGSSALDMCFVGAGRIEASIYGNLTAVDIAAAIGFIREAGGIVVGKGGSDVTALSKEKQPMIAVNNKEILEALRKGINI